MIKLGPILMPCRFCSVPPGLLCINKNPGKFHGIREKDARRASELLE